MSVTEVPSGSLSFNAGQAERRRRWEKGEQECGLELPSGWQIFPAPASPQVPKSLCPHLLLGLKSFTLRGRGLDDLYGF